MHSIGLMGIVILNLLFFSNEKMNHNDDSTDIREYLYVLDNTEVHPGTCVWSKRFDSLEKIPHSF